MFKNKITLIIFALIVIVAAFTTSQVLAFKSIESANQENASAKNEIQMLDETIKKLNNALLNAHGEIQTNKEQIEKYQEILNAWKNATKDVNEAVSRILSAYDEVSGKECLYPEKSLVGIEDKMMDAVYGAIRSTTPLELAKSFEKEISQLVKSRFDKVLESKIEKIEKNGIEYPDDEAAATDLAKYFGDLNKNPQIAEKFAEMGLTTKVGEVFLSFENAKNDYNYRTALIKSIRESIDRLNKADPKVTHDEIAQLNTLIDELLATSESLESLNTSNKNYVNLLALVRLLPRKNEAFAEIKSTYDTYYTQANGNRDLIISLVEIKDAALNDIESAKSLEEIENHLQKAKEKFAKCFK